MLQGAELLLIHKRQILSSAVFGRKHSMRPLLALVLVATVALTTGCATVHVPKTVPVITEDVIVSKVLEQERSGRFLKRKVAIARFTNETKYGKGLFSGDDLIGKQASDILTSKLAQTEKFILFESDFVDGERTGNYRDLNLPADYLIVGSVSEFGRQVTGSTGVFSRTKKQTAHAKVSVRLVRVSTGQVIYGDEGAGDAFVETGTVLGGGDSAGYDSSLNDKAISGAISQLVNSILDNLLHDPWRAYILDVDSGTIVMSGGASQGIEVGDSFGIYRKGKSVANPQTGLDIELPGTLVGRLSVISMSGTNAYDEVSICSLDEGDIIEEPASYYIQELGGDGKGVVK